MQPDGEGTAAVGADNGVLGRLRPNDARRRWNRPPSRRRCPMLPWSASARVRSHAPRTLVNLHSMPLACANRLRQS